MQVKQTFFKSMIIILPVFFVIIAFEIYLRYAATHIVSQEISSGFVSSAALLIRYTPNGRRLIPNAHVIIRNHHLSKRDIVMDINSLGFRDHELSPAKRKNELRILALGDSITWGAYLQADQVYVQRLEEYLNNSSQAKTFEVINTGVVDIGLKEEIDILEEKGLSAQPDIVMVEFYLNDSRPPWGFPNEIKYRGWLRQHSVLAETMYKNLKLKKWLNEKGVHRHRWRKVWRTLDWSHNRKEFLELVKNAKYDWGAAWQTSSWNIIDQNFLRLKSLSKQHGFKVVVVAFPVSFQVYADFIEDFPQQTLGKKAAKLGFYFFDLLPVLRKHSDEDLFFDRCHPKEKANDIIGKAIAGFLRKQVIPTF